MDTNGIEDYAEGEFVTQSIRMASSMKVNNMYFKHDYAESDQTFPIVNISLFLKVVDLK